MTNDKHAMGETNRGGEGSLGEDADTLKQGVFAEWKADHPEGTPAQFEAAWAAMTGAAARPVVATPSASASEAAILKHRFFEEWIAQRPGRTRQQFEDEWATLEATLVQ